MMNCPYVVDERSTGSTSRCRAVLVPFELSQTEQEEYCETPRHLACPLYRNAGMDVVLAIRSEIARAID
ncbi:MAG: hypothetical protein ACREI3_11350 [Nitrospirales bacterium]